MRYTRHRNFKKKMPISILALEGPILERKVKDSLSDIAPAGLPCAGGWYILHTGYSTSHEEKKYFLLHGTCHSTRRSGMAVY